MTANTQTLTRIRNLERLYRGGYHSRVIDTTIDKLVEIEATALQRELTSQEERLKAFEAQYALSSEEFYSRFRAGKMGDRPICSSGVRFTRCGRPRSSACRR